MAWAMAKGISFFCKIYVSFKMEQGDLMKTRMINIYFIDPLMFQTISRFFDSGLTENIL